MADVDVDDSCEKEREKCGGVDDGDDECAVARLEGARRWGARESLKRVCVCCERSNWLKRDICTSITTSLSAFAPSV